MVMQDWLKWEVIGMQNNKALVMADMIVDTVIDKMGRNASDFQIRNINEDDNHKSFTVEFVAYDYYWVGVDYDKGIMTPYIISGNRILRIKRCVGWWEKIDLADWIEALDTELKLRIPDKYLEKYRQGG